MPNLPDLPSPARPSGRSALYQAIMEFIKEWGAVMAVPSLLLPAVCQALGASTTTTGIITIGACLAVGVAMRSAGVRHAVAGFKAMLVRIPVWIPWIGILIMLVTSVYAYYGPRDEWEVWQRNLFSTLDKCGHDPKPDACVTSALATHLRPAVRGGDSGLRVDLAADLRAGAILLKHPLLKTKLKEWLGIDDKFLGAGFAQPFGSVTYADARLPEVLIENYSLTDGRVWIWQIEPRAESVNRTIRDIVKNDPPMRGREESGLKDLRAGIQNTTGSDGMSPVIRFAQPDDLSGCLGLIERWRVFASRLGPVLDLELPVAVRLSGVDRNPDKRLFLMVFVPSDPARLVPATWPTIMSGLQTWTQARKKCF